MTPTAWTEKEAEMARRLRSLGYRLVALDVLGTRRFPVLRVRMEHSDLERRIGTADCATASRALERWLDALPEMPGRYRLEVSSPGFDRPLSKPRDFVRFRGERIIVRGQGVAETGNRIVGTLLGLAPAREGAASGSSSSAGVSEPESVIELRTPGGDVARVPRRLAESIRLHPEEADAWK